MYSQLVALSHLLFSGNEADNAKLKENPNQAFGGIAKQSKLVLMNMRERPYLVADFADFLGPGILFPGNTTATPQLTKPVLQVSTDYTGLSSDGSYFAEGNVGMRAYAVAYSQAKLQEDLLPNYAIVNNSLSFGGFVLNETWATQRINTYRDQLGLLFHPFGYGGTSTGVNRVFQKLVISVPTNSVANTPELTDPKQLPLYYTTRSGPAALALATARFFHAFGWKKAAFIYSEGTEDIAFYENFVNVSAQYDIEIVNDQQHRFIPFAFASVNKQLNETLRHIMASSVRILIIAHPVSFLLVERLYDLGARPGDFLICLFYGLSYSLYAGSDTSFWKRRQVIKGAMMFYDRYFIGKEGSYVRKLLFEADGLNYDPVSCALYDSVMLLLQALKFMLMSGLHYEDGYALMQQIRNSRLIGCLGALQLGKGSNERTPGDYSILNAKYDEEKDTLVLEDAAVYSPVKVQMYNISSEIMFPDGSSQ